MGKWVLSYSFESIGSQGTAPFPGVVKEVKVDGCWRVTFHLLTLQADAWYLDGISAGSFGHIGIATSSFGASKTVVVGGAVVGDKPVFMQGSTEFRASFNGAIVVEREYLTWEE